MASFKIFLVTLVICGFQVATCDDMILTILHTNDVHSRFLETNKHSGGCSEADQQKNACFGGFARLHYKVTEIRKTHPNVIYLSGGDYYQGTVWYTLYKWRVISHFVNILNHTAMALGNHEFDDNIDGLVPFLETATFPIISSNIDASKEPRMQGKFKKSVVVEVGGRKIGIIGYTTKETLDISNPGKLGFESSEVGVAKEAKKLHEEGIQIIVAVGHAGYDVDQKVALVPYIDAVVGGHTNTFLYHGEPPHIEKPLGDYPTIVTQENGRKVPVVQAYAYGKYLGYLNLTFNDEGEVTGWNGNPILLDGSIPQDLELLEEVKEWGKNISVLTKEKVGETRVFLDGKAITCRLQECNLGNFIADAMVYLNLKFADSLYWSDVTMAVINGGGIRSSIDETNNNGSVTMEDVLTVLPFQNTIDLVELKGEDLLAMFEHSVIDFDPKGHHLAGKFLQVSGIRVTYDIRKPNGERVKELLVLCKKCRVPSYVPVNLQEVYKVAIPTYIATGGDGYDLINEKKLAHHLSGILDSDMLVEYFQERSPVIQGTEGRITFFNETDCENNAITFKANSFMLIVPIIVYTILYRD